MNWFDLSYLLIGVFLCLVVVGQIAFWSSDLWRNAWQSRRDLKQWQGLNRSRIDQRLAVQPSSPEVVTRLGEGQWNGWRVFRVADLKSETRSATSVYLVPADGKPVPDFQPGQFLTLRFQLPGQRKPLVRCYSLSSAPEQRPYRITVKQVAPRDGNSPGSVSEHINRRLKVGEMIEAKMPAGDFVLRDTSPRPTVMLAAGVGITPLYSMILALLTGRSLDARQRPVILFYGNSGREDHLFARELARLAVTYSNFVVVNCYSRSAAAGENAEVPCHYRERVSVRLVKELIPSLDADFYLCGPAGFMQSNYDELRAAGVAGAQIFFEAFGPASIDVWSSPHPLAAEAAVAESMAGMIAFTKSGKQADCPAGKSILDLAEDCDIPIDTGCRAGNCGTCAVRLLKGSVRYLKNNHGKPEPGTCLTCIAQPEGEVQVEA